MVTSRNTTTAPTVLPARSRIGAAESWIAISWPWRFISTLCSARSTTLPSRRQRSSGFSRSSRAHFIQQPQHLADRLAARLGAGPAGELLGDRIEVIDAAFAVGGDHRIADRLQRHLRAFLLGEHRLLGALARGDVGHRALEGHDALLGVAQHARAFQRDHLLAIATAQQHLGVVDFALHVEPLLEARRARPAFQYSVATLGSA